MCTIRPQFNYFIKIWYGVIFLYITLFYICSCLLSCLDEPARRYTCMLIYNCLHSDQVDKLAGGSGGGTAMTLDVIRHLTISDDEWGYVRGKTTIILIINQLQAVVCMKLFHTVHVFGTRSPWPFTFCSQSSHCWYLLMYYYNKYYNYSCREYIIQRLFAHPAFMKNIFEKLPGPHR